MITKKEQWVEELHRALLAVDDRELPKLQKVLKYGNLETLKRDINILIDVMVIDKDKMRRA